MCPDDDDHSDDVRRLQQTANEKLVLSSLRAHEEADIAIGALRHAEREAIELRAREEHLQLTAEFRERLIGIIGHDLRNPLNTIVMASGLLIDRGQLDEDGEALMRRILATSHRMARMITQLSSFTRARLGGGFKLRRVAADLGEVCDGIAEEHRIASLAEIRRTSQGDLRGRWDTDLLAEVMSNLVGNAVQYATAGTPVVIEVRADGEAVVADVTNQGVSIPPEMLPTIFEAFRRADTEEHSRSEDLGLGLYISSEIAQAHGGTLGVRSAHGTTTFSLRLPRARGTLVS